MTRRARRNHSAGFKAKVAMAAVKGDKTLSEIAQAFDAHANQIVRWKTQLQDGAAGVFGSGSRSPDPNTPAVDIKALQAKICELTLENDFLEGALTKAGMLTRKAMIDRDHQLPVSKQAEALNISRGSIYYLPRPVPDRGLALMRRMDELHMDFPFAGGGARMLGGLLNGEGLTVGRKHTASLMKKMGVSALYRKPNTSKPEPGHKSRVPTRSGPRTSHISPWRRASSPSRRCWTGTPGGCFPGASRSPWKRRSASKPSKRLWKNIQSPISSTAPAKAGVKAVSSPRKPSPKSCSATRSPSQWMARALRQRQCLCRTAVAIRQIPGGPSQGLHLSGRSP